jgi:hypothetical protein
MVHHLVVEALTTNQSINKSKDQEINKQTKKLRNKQREAETERGTFSPKIGNRVGELLKSPISTWAAGR